MRTFGVHIFKNLNLNIEILSSEKRVTLLDEMERGGVSIVWGTCKTSLGLVAVALIKGKICKLNFIDGKYQELFLKELSLQWPKIKLLKSQKHIKPFESEIKRRVLGQSQLTLNLLLTGTLFQIKVWLALLSIKDGSVSSYKDVATQIGSPKAYRAVGTAVGVNPIGIIIPCHRVVKSTGEIGEYHWGAEKKRRLLTEAHLRLL